MKTIVETTAEMAMMKQLLKVVTEQTLTRQDKTKTVAVLAENNSNRFLLELSMNIK